jgi:DNA-binding protein H-NS
MDTDMTAEQIAELMAKREALDAEIAALRKAARSKVLAEVKKSVAEYDLTPAEVFGGAKSGRKGTGGLPPQFRDPESGKTWTGRGRAPAWIEGKDREAFRI